MLDKIDGIKLAIGGTLGSMGALALTPLLPVKDAFIALCFLMMLDFILGLYTASIGKSKNSSNGKITSRIFLDGLFKKTFYLMVVYSMYYIDLGMGTGFIQMSVILGIALGELISLLETMTVLEWHIPDALKKLVDVWETKEKEKNL